MTTGRFAVLLLVVICICGVSGSALAAERRAQARWEALPVDFGAPAAGHGGWMIGEGPNPHAMLPAERVRGRWVRFSAIVATSDSGIGLRINASAGGRTTGSVPVVCDKQPTMQRCTTVLWVAADVERIEVVIWADQQIVEVSQPRVEVATLPGHRTIGDRVDGFVSQVRKRYYRTNEMDWPVLRRTIGAIPAPPADLDPTPAIAAYLRTQLPGNKHVFVRPKAATTAPASRVALPTCATAAGDIGVVTLPGLTSVTGDAPTAYADALHDCLMQTAPRRAWLVDLRGNDGGNMYPMIGGLAPLLPVGRLYAFADGKRVETGEVGVDARGVTFDHRTVFAARDAGTRTRLPVIVVFGARCGSSCEQTVNALAARDRTLLVGEPTAGYLTSNIVLPINDDYVFLLTTGYTQNPCGRVIEDNLLPDVSIDGVAKKSIDDVLAWPEVRAWLDTRPLEDATLPTASTRCASPAAFAPAKTARASAK